MKTLHPHLPGLGPTVLAATLLLLAGIALVMTLAPLADCPACDRDGLDFTLHRDVDGSIVHESRLGTTCPLCAGTLEVTPFKRWTYRAPEPRP